MKNEIKEGQEYYIKVKVAGNKDDKLHVTLGNDILICVKPKDLIPIQDKLTVDDIQHELALKFPSLDNIARLTEEIKKALEDEND